MDPWSLWKEGTCTWPSAVRLFRVCLLSRDKTRPFLGSLSPRTEWGGRTDSQLLASCGTLWWVISSSQFPVGLEGALRWLVGLLCVLTSYASFPPLHISCTRICFLDSTSWMTQPREKRLKLYLQIPAQMFMLEKCVYMRMSVGCVYVCVYDFMSVCTLLRGWKAAPNY
jgi:hypothetical protein